MYKPYIYTLKTPEDNAIDVTLVLNVVLIHADNFGYFQSNISGI